MDPTSFDFTQYGKVLPVSKEGVRDPYSTMVESARRDGIYPVRVQKGDHEAGLLTWAVKLVIDLNRLQYFEKNRYLSTTPKGWRAQALAHLSNFVAVLRSA